MSGLIWVCTVCERYHQGKKVVNGWQSVNQEKFSLYYCLAVCCSVVFVGVFFFLFTKMKILKPRYNLQTSSMMINLRKHLVWLE